MTKSAYLQVILLRRIAFLVSVKALLFYLILIFFIVFAPCRPGLTVFAESKYTIYFYNPESNIDNYASLKTKFDLYLKKIGPYQFQPFSNRNTFENKTRGQHNCVLILSSWYYKELKNLFSIKPVLIGTLDDNSYQKKVLIAKKNINCPAMLKGCSIASSGGKEYTVEFLQSMLKEKDKEIVETLQILNVPKDIDALISIGFGLVQAALTTEYSIEMLADINNGLYKNLSILAMSEESLLPVVAIPAESGHVVPELVETIANMEETPDGKSNIQMLGLDGWKMLDENDWELLQK
ncbi:MAG: phosphate/phosphite/phosphonate ABC transporter substrate-binding protein [Candidatus Kuenenia sp.]|nr:phosphate/phosphite/phosphonate ABC transporter substrate-binding protein [Candidatus Kuenenia hertensis]